MGQVRPENRGSAAARHRLHLAFAWATALLLPVVSTALTSHLELFQRVPFALFLASIAITAWFGYTTPVALSILVSLPLYNYFIAPPMSHWSLQPDEILRDAVLLLIAALIAVLNIRLRTTQVSLARSEAAYRTTLTSIGDAVIATDPGGMVTFMNPVAEALTGWARSRGQEQAIVVVFSHFKRRDRRSCRKSSGEGAAAGVYRWDGQSHQPRAAQWNVCPDRRQSALHPSGRMGSATVL